MSEKTARKSIREAAFVAEKYEDLLGAVYLLPVDAWHLLCYDMSGRDEAFAAMDYNTGLLFLYFVGQE